MFLEQLIVVVSVTFLVMVSPGPDMIIVMRNTFHGGQSAGLRTSLGVLTGNLVHITYCVLGIGWLISKSILAFNMLKYAGAAYLIYLGIRSLLASRQCLKVEQLKPGNDERGMFLQGFINNILNPKGTMFYLGVFTLVITPQTPVFNALALMVAMMSVSTLFWVVFVYALERPLVRGLLDRGQRAVNAAFGVLLVTVGLRVAVAER